MINGRHLVLLGGLACAGLVSVHMGQQQIDLCYKLGALEKDLRDTRDEIEVCRIKHLALQSPKAVNERIAELKLKLGPAAGNNDLVTAPVPNGTATREVQRSLGSPSGARTVIVPQAQPVPANTRVARSGEQR